MSELGFLGLWDFRKHNFFHLEHRREIFVLGCDRLSSLLIVRTDAEGRVLPDSTSAVVTIDAERHLTAYPNPFTEELYLQHELGRSANYRLVDISGHVLIELEAEAPMHTYKIPMTSYVAGPYYIQLWEAGELRGTVKVVKQ